MTAAARLIRVPFPAGLVMLTPGEESRCMTLVAQQPLNASRREGAKRYVHPFLPDSSFGVGQPKNLGTCR